MPPSDLSEPGSPDVAKPDVTEPVAEKDTADAVPPDDEKEADEFVEDDPVDTEPIVGADGQPVEQDPGEDAPPPLPDLADIVPSMKPSDPAIQASWDQAAVNAQQAVVLAEQSLEQIKALAAHDGHPFDEKNVEAAEASVELASKRLAIVEKAQGRKAGEIAKVTIATINENIQQAQQQIAQWKQLRSTHQDFLDNPAAHGFTDNGGAPLIPSEQAAHVAAYDVAIDQARDRIRALKVQRDAVKPE